MERFDGQVDETRCRIDRDRVGVVADVPLAELDQSMLGDTKDRYDPALARDVQAPSLGVDGKDIGIAPHAMDLPDLHALKVHDEQARIAIAGDERHPLRHVEQQSMVVLTSCRQAVAGDDAIRCRIDGRNGIEGLKVDQYVPGNRVIDRHARSTVQRDRGDAAIGGSIDDRFGSARLVRQEEPSHGWHEGAAIRKAARRNPGHNF